MEKMEKVSPEIYREEELSETVRGFQVLYGKSHEGFKEKAAVKNAWVLTLLFHFFKLSYSFGLIH